eukprot:9497167-Pyramimonas_sp.AAC.1
MCSVVLVCPAGLSWRACVCACACACVEYVHVRPCEVVRSNALLCRAGLPCSCGQRERMLPVRVCV